MEDGMKRLLLPLIAVLLFLFVSPSFAAKIPADAGQTGTLVSSEESWHSRAAGVNGMIVSREYPIVHYVIDTAQYVYEADLALRHQRDKRPALTVNGSIKFAFVKSDLYIQDENGKEIEVKLTKKMLK
jgi:hypothetical protein